MHHWIPAEENLPAAVDALRNGKLVGMPTETVYGLAGNATDAKVVASIFEAKERPTFDPLIVHASSIEAALALSPEVPDTARLLAERFWPGPLTLVLPRSPALPDLLSAGLDTVAIRVPQHPIARQLIQDCGFPLAAPSANRFGNISPTTADHVMRELDEAPAVAGVLDAGSCSYGLESTVIGFPASDRVVVYRLGGLPIERLAEYVDDLEVVRAFDAVDDPEVAKRGEQSPGMLARHYAPRTPLLLLHPDEAVPATFADKRSVELNFERLSASGSLNEAAATLFAKLRELDESGVDLIVARRVPDEGLGKAINDRLYRASMKVRLPVDPVQDPDDRW